MSSVQVHSFTGCWSSLYLLAARLENHSQKVDHMTSTEKTTPQAIPMSRIYQGPDTSVSPMLRSVEDAISSYTSISQQLEAADGNREAAIAAWKESAPDTKAVQLRERIAKATAELNALAESKVVVKVLSEDEKKKLAVEQDSFKEVIRKGRKLINDFVNLGTFSIDPEGVKDALDKIGDPTKGTRGRTEGSPGSNLPRVSVDSVVNGGELKNVHYGTFSAIALALNVEVAELQNAFAKQAGVSPENIKEVKKALTFNFVARVNDKETVYTIATTPKKRKERGSSETVAVAADEIINDEDPNNVVVEKIAG